MLIRVQNLSGWILKPPKRLPEVWGGDWDIEVPPEPERPELRLITDKMPPDECVARILELLK